MKYEVLITDPAREELDAAYLWLVQQTERHAPTWHNGLVDAILSLENSPGRCLIAPSSENAATLTRQLLYGRRQDAYRILFSIRGEQVIVLHILHGARQF